MKNNRRFLVIITPIIILAILLLSIVSQAAVDDNYTVSLLHMDGVDTSTTSTDDSGKTWVNHGDAQIDTAQSKFGGASALFDGTGDYIDTADATGFDFGTEDFTIDMWIKPSSLDLPAGFFGFSQGESAFSFYRYFAQFAYWNGTGGGYFGNTLSINVWQHVAIVRSSGVIMGFVDGVKGNNTYNDTTNFVTSSYAIIGSSIWNEYYTGWIDELRISKGIARWTSNFTPPAAQYEPTSTFTQTFTPSETVTPSLTPSETPTFTLTPSDTPTQTFTPTFTFTPTDTATFTPTFTPTITDTPTNTRTLIPPMVLTTTYEAAYAYYTTVAADNYPTTIILSILCGVVILGLIVWAVITFVRRR
jgi:hypothetical protein